MLYGEHEEMAAFPRVLQKGWLDLIERKVRLVKYVAREIFPQVFDPTGSHPDRIANLQPSYFVR
jgi:hypothetical protein